MRMHLATVAVHVALLLPAFAAASTVYEVNTATATQTGSKNNGGVYIGQSFNSGTNTLLTTASIEMNRNGLSIANFILELRAVTGTPGNYLATGAALASGTYSNSILSDSLATSYTFTNLNWSLTPSTVYMIGVASESTASVKWTLNQSGTQNSSTGFITGYSGYNAQEGTNVDNGLHGATITAVPEPASLMMLAAGAAGIAAIRRRHRPARG
jgi:hypothetical protein